jgi:hypothetical protein
MAALCEPFRVGGILQDLCKAKGNLEKGLSSGFPLKEFDLHERIDLQGKANKQVATPGKF